ncbi:MAG: class I SAM-dependent methyltransferase [Verrucomicrobiota bacterium]|jgi:SAM-dependent methyltransferase
MSARRIARFWTSLRESAAYWLGGKDNLVPPRRLIDGVGGGDFTAVGREFFRYFTDIGGMKPDHRVLDVGCGCGRMAVPLIPFLSGVGEYHGFDIVPDAIKWSQRHIARKYPRFRFELADIYNKLYNNEGKIKSSEYRFAYADNFFDFTFLTSVFTHMLAGDMEHYLSEIARTLKPGGKCMINYFLLNPESKALMEQGASSIQFKHALPDCVTSDKKTPEAAVAFEESFVRQCFAKYRLNLIEPIHFGGWPGRKQQLSYQDIILAVKG